MKNEFFTRQLCALQQGAKAPKKFAGCEKGRENYMTLEMKLDERYRQGMEKGRAEGLEAGRAEGHEAGRALGRIENLANLVRKKLQKGKSLSVIAEECEEEESVIQEIIDSINAEHDKNGTK